MVDDADWSQSTRVVTRSRREPAPRAGGSRRAPATFGSGGEPVLGASVRTFVHRYGWRAYALPVLLLVTVAALLTVKSAPAPGHASGGRPAADNGAGTIPSSPPVAPTTIPLKSDASDSTANNTALKVGELPRGGPYTKVGDGTFRVLKGSTKIVGRTGRLFRYDVEIENGITGVDADAFAALVDKTLHDPRSWSGHGVRVQRVASGPVDFHVSLTSTMTVRKYCGYDVPVETSCYAPAGATAALSVNRVVLNVARWVRGASPYVGDLATYRVYMINHEDGHAMGHQHAHQCLPGGLAPVMMQQTYGLKSAVTGTNCGANPWPYPPGVKGAPGAEQPDTRQNSEYYLNGD